MVSTNRILLTLGVLAFSAGVTAAQEKAEPLKSPLSLTAQECKACHSAHYQEWEQSYHAKSMVSIQAGLKRFITTEEQVKGRSLNKNELMACVGCHAPAMRFAGEDEFTRLATLVKTDQKEALAELNVDCVACHALVVNGHSDVRPENELSRQVFHASIRNPVKTVHGSQYASPMEGSQFCKSCHTYVTPADMKVQADWDIVCSLTFDAWRDGPLGPNAKPGSQKQCQACHMEKKDGKAASAGAQAIPSRKVSSHLFAGWHSPASLQRATSVAVQGKPGAQKGTAEVLVTIENKAGHRIPDT